MYTDSDSQLDLSFRRLEFQTSGFRIDVGQWTEVRTKMVLVAAKAADVDVKMEAGISQSIRIQIWSVSVEARPKKAKQHPI